MDANGNAKLARCYETLFGPPYPGMEARVNAFLTTFETTEKNRHQENQDKLAEISAKMSQRSLWVTILGVVGTFACLVVSVLAIWAMFYLAKHAQVEPMKLFSQQPDMVVSSEQDSAAPMY